MSLIIDNLSKNSICQIGKDYINYIDGEKNSITDKEKNIRRIPYREYSRECICVFGSSGSGKSTWIANYVSKYHKLFPKREIYLISSKGYDEAFDKDYISRIDITDDSVEYLKFSDFGDSLIIIDDSFFPAYQQQEIDSFMNDILMMGRSLGISLLISKHLINGGRENSIIKTECHSIVCFPNHNARGPLVDYLKKSQFDKETISKIIKHPSRAVEIRIQHPHLIITDRDIFYY